MTSYRTAETVVRRVTWAAEAGSDIATVNKVQAMAWSDYCQRTGTDRDGTRYDDWCRVEVGDDEIRFVFEVEHKPEAGELAVARTREALTKLIEVWLDRGQRLHADDFNLISDALGGAGLS